MIDIKALELKAIISISVYDSLKDLKVFLAFANALVVNHSLTSQDISQ